MEDKVHFYGWERVKQSIIEIANNNNIKIIDYVDNYFLNLNTSVVVTDWYGIIHHTPSDFSGNNIQNLFKYTKFIESLNKCKALITLSEYNKLNIKNELDKIGLDIRIIVIKHPIPPIVDKKFNIELFEQNLKIYNIGGWLRNPYTIYKAKILYNGISLNKIKLKGTYMNQYFPPDDFNISSIIHNIDNIKSNIVSYSSDFLNRLYNNYIIMCRPNNYINYYLKYLFEYAIDLYYNKSSNYYNKKEQLINHLELNHNSVEIKEYINNDDYLNMLISSLVFCEYIDCSASNTIVECISTGTPIILNYHQAIEEYLGIDYPLYYHKVYDKNTDTYNLTSEKILETHNYLLDIKNKGDLELEYLKNILNNIIT